MAEDEYFRTFRAIMLTHCIIVEIQIICNANL
jgi:hypothetical protein